MQNKRDRKNAARLKRIMDVMSGRKSMLIVLQDFPDPDAVAAAAALKELSRMAGIMTVSIACGGVVGRSENRALVKYMEINMLRISNLDLAQYDLIAMVDTQPTSGNNALPHDVMPHIVIDHHPVNRNTRKCVFHDIRKHYGSTSTILYEYLRAAAAPVSTQLATALVYGIRSDTDDLGREVSQFDVDAFVALYPLVNHRIMGRIQMASLPVEYFGMLHDAIASARRYGASIISNMGEIRNPDGIGEVADLFLRGENCQWALCTGRYEGRLLLSIRTVDPQRGAGHVMKMIVSRKGTGGGHGAMAGGQVPLENLSQKGIMNLEKTVLNRFLKHTGAAGVKAEKLVN